MNPQQPREAAGSRASRASDQLPPLLGAARFRYAMAAFAVLLGLGFFIWGLVKWGLESGFEPPETVLVAALLLPATVAVWLPSLYIARGLLQGRRRAVAGALVHDALMVLACGGVVAAVLRSPSDVLFDPAQADPYILGASLLLGVPFAAEAGYLLWAVLFRSR
jgi:hypothetical protein